MTTHGEQHEVAIYKVVSFPDYDFKAIERGLRREKRYRVVDSWTVEGGTRAFLLEKVLY